MTSKRIAVGIVALGVMSGAAGFAAAGATVQDASSPHDKLAVWAGHWKIHAETKETLFGHAKTLDFDNQCSFSPHGAFMVCENLSLQSDPDNGRISNDVSLLYYSDVDKTFKYTDVHPEGGPHEEVTYVDGNVWTRPIDIPRPGGGVANARFVYNFVSPNKRLARFEISTDKGARWTLVTEFVGTKER